MTADGVDGEPVASSGPDEAAALREMDTKRLSKAAGAMKDLDSIAKSERKRTEESILLNVGDSKTG